MKTLALFCALDKHGCAFEDIQDFTTVTRGSESNIDSDDDDDTTSVKSQPTAAYRRKTINRHATGGSRCPGQLVIQRDRFNRSFIQYVFLYCLVRKFMSL